MVQPVDDRAEQDDGADDDGRNEGDEHAVLDGGRAALVYDEEVVLEEMFAADRPGLQGNRPTKGPGRAGDLEQAADPPVRFSA